MASYQIPQFLDSGDKILGPFNMRQFGYALGGFMLSFLVATIVQGFAPGLGVYAYIPAAPVAALSLYLAAGKYNGRDSEIYVLKYIIFNSKPKFMVYARVPNLDDLNQRLSELTEEKILKKWTGVVTQNKAVENNSFLIFNQNDSSQKARKIRELGGNIDISLTNTLAEVQRRQLEIEEKERALQIAASQQNQGQKR